MIKVTLEMPLHAAERLKELWEKKDPGLLQWFKENEMPLEALELLPPHEIHDIVEIARMNKTDRRFNGTESVKRPPAIGDRGTIVDIHENQDGSQFYTVESVDDKGNTIWFADFAFNELIGTGENELNKSS